ncbi:MAG: hypothetical protein RL207_958 [Bacteroidota bacterium]|jgi:uncharacterized protein involved in exopolysaccharide biosynthesis
MSNQSTENQLQKDEVSLKELILKGKEWFAYLWGYKWYIIIAGILGGALGFAYAKYFTKPSYTSTVSFTMEQKGSSGGALGGLASSLGLGDLPSSSSSGMFGGENVLYLMKSNRIIHQSLKEAQAELKGDNLLNAYLLNHFEKPLKEKKIKLFPQNLDTLSFTRKQDSLLLAITKTIREAQIVAERQDKKTTIINLDVKDVNEQWAYLFSKALVKNAIDLYLEIKVGKLMRTENELIQKKDSIRGLLDGSITTLAFETDMNSHTPLMRYKTNQAKKQIDVEVLKSMYSTVIQNLEVTKIQRAQEEPIIEIIDEPLLPLEKNQFGKLKGLILGAILVSLLIAVVLICRKVLIGIIR